MPFTQAKAKKVLGEKNPTLQGRPISRKQRGLLGLVAGGKQSTRLSNVQRAVREETA